MADPAATDSSTDTSTYTLPDDHFTALNASGPPAIEAFTGTAGDGSPQGPNSLQVTKGTVVTLTWQIAGQVDELSVEGANESPAADATSMTDTPQADVTYTLHAKNQYGEDQMTLMVSVHAANVPVSPHAPVAPAVAPPAATGPIWTGSGNDVVIDPPVRLWPQWAGKGVKGSKLQGDRQLAGADGKDIPWFGSGCGPSSAAMILRWFAEDCKAGRILFPVKAGSTIDRGLYGPRMAQAFWPDGFKYYPKDKPGNPIGKVELDNSGVDNVQLQNRAAKLLGAAKSYRVSSTPVGGWLPKIAEMLKVGPVILGIGPPSPEGHYIVGSGVRNGALLIVDPGNVIYSAWNGQAGFRSGINMPSVWPFGPPPKGTYEDDSRAYGEVSGTLLTKLLAGLKSVTSLTYPAAPVFADGSTAPALTTTQPAATASAAPTDATGGVCEADPGAGSGAAASSSAGGPVQKVFTFASTYNAYQVGNNNSAYFLKGRYMVDLDGAPNCYHPTEPCPVVKYNYAGIDDISTFRGPLDSLGNAHSGDNWFGVVCDPKTNERQIQGQGTAKGPCDGFYVSATSLVDASKAWNDQDRYVDSRTVPYFAMPAPIYRGTAASNFQVINAACKTGEKGDYATVYDPSTGKYTHAIFADVGGKDHFGEGSYALGKALGTLKGIDDPKLLYIIYPHSGAGAHVIPSTDDIQSKGDALFATFGGVDEAKRVLSLMT